MTGNVDRSGEQGDWVLVVLGLGVVAGSLGIGWSGTVAALLVLVLPVLGFVLLGHVPGRGGAVACLVLAFGAGLSQPVAGTVAWGDLGLLALLATGSMAGARVAERLAPAAPTPAPAGGRWVTIVVECQDPPTTSERQVRPRVAPRCDPERRSLTRRAGETLRGPKGRRIVRGESAAKRV